MAFFYINLNAKDYIQSVYNLIERITPGYSSQYKLELISDENGEDVYELDNVGNKVVLRGNNAVALASAFNWYLKYTCNAHISWMGDQLDLPKRLPLPKKERRVINGKYRVYMNYCTISYSAAWWDWKRWEREIDFMAMNGINMPLATIGLDAVWYNTLLRFKYTDEEARAFLTYPGHSAWQWMQNIQSFSEPLPKCVIDKHIDMGKKIMERFVELGMKPIQQGFSGYVPVDFGKKFPNANIRMKHAWCAHPQTAQLDPTDPLFKTFGKALLEEERKLFGTYGFYASDPFHESAPPINTKEYLNSVGNSISELFYEFDPDYTWVMQSWSIQEHIVKAVPKEKLLILDLDGHRKRGGRNGKVAFWGYNLVTGNLHNFGGRINMHGDLKLTASNQYATLKERYPNICGSGLFMEGIEHNPIYFDLLFEMPNHKGSIDVYKWLDGYADRRYGYKSDAARKAMRCLLEGPYEEGSNGTEFSSIVAARPALKVKKSGPNGPLNIKYNPLLLVKAQELLLTDAKKLKSSDAYRFDLVDVQRQIMTNMGQLIHMEAAEAFRNKNKKDFELHSGRFLELLSDMETLLRTRKEYSLDRWLDDARKWGDTEDEKNLMEKDATALVTIWGPYKNPTIFDYSWREWAGLVGNYYLPRWKMFYQMLEEHLSNGTEYSEEGLPLAYGREAFRANDFYSKLADWELNFVNTYNKVRKPITKGDELKIARKLFKKYLQLVDVYYKDSDNLRIINNEEFIENFGD